jgi:hypothetical protein
MRHSAATIAIDQGVALPVVQEMLGRSDIRVTSGYVDVSSPLAQDAAARIGRGAVRRNCPENCSEGVIVMTPVHPLRHRPELGPSPPWRVPRYS